MYRLYAHTVTDLLPTGVNIKFFNMSSVCEVTEGTERTVSGDEYFLKAYNKKKNFSRDTVLSVPSVTSHTVLMLKNLIFTPVGNKSVSANRTIENSCSVNVSNM
jgi:hypothetical protein